MTYNLTIQIELHFTIQIVDIFEHRISLPKDCRLIWIYNFAAQMHDQILIHNFTIQVKRNLTMDFRYPNCTEWLAYTISQSILVA